MIFPHDKEQFTYCPEPEQTEELPTLPVPEKRPRLNPTNEEATVPSSLPQTSGPNFHPAAYSQPSVSRKELPSVKNSFEPNLIFTTVLLIMYFHHLLVSRIISLPRKI